MSEFVQSFLAAEFSRGVPTSDRSPFIAATGRIAEIAIKSPLLAKNLAEAGIVGEGFRAFQEIDDLVEDPTWTMALVLSPHKRDIGRVCQESTPIARQIGVYDTLVRTSAESIIGINTNAFAAAEAVRQFMSGRMFRRVLILGAGASARSVGLGLHHHFPELELGILGRSAQKAEEVVEDIKTGTVVRDYPNFSAELVINTTTVGQTDDQDTLAFDIDKVLDEEVRFFDLNNRESKLQQTARDKGCFVMSGGLMQILTNQLRAQTLASSLKT